MHSAAWVVVDTSDTLPVSVVPWFPVYENSVVAGISVGFGFGFGFASGTPGMPMVDTPGVRGDRWEVVRIAVGTVDTAGTVDNVGSSFVFGIVCFVFADIGGTVLLVPSSS